MPLGGIAQHLGEVGVGAIGQGVQREAQSEGGVRGEVDLAALGLASTVGALVDAGAEVDVGSEAGELAGVLELTVDADELTVGEPEPVRVQHAQRSSEGLVAGGCRCGRCRGAVASHGCGGSRSRRRRCGCGRCSRGVFYRDLGCVRVGEVGGAFVVEQCREAALGCVSPITALVDGTVVVRVLAKQSPQRDVPHALLHGAPDAAVDAALTGGVGDEPAVRLQ